MGRKGLAEERGKGDEGMNAQEMRERDKKMQGEPHKDAPINREL